MFDSCLVFEVTTVIDEGKIVIGMIATETSVAGMTVAETTVAGMTVAGMTVAGMTVAGMTVIEMTATRMTATRMIRDARRIGAGMTTDMEMTGEIEVATVTNMMYTLNLSAASVLLVLLYCTHDMKTIDTLMVPVRM